MIGEKIGKRYELFSLIGEGGMSRVYKAKDLFLDRIVAIKVLKEEFIEDEEFVERFKREAKNSAGLAHRNIVRVLDVGEENNLYYLVMEYIDGRTLKEVILRKGPLDVASIVEIAKQICDALDYAHKNYLIHRDIKPHNILIDNRGVVKVTDFGIARAVTADTITNSKDVFGSVHYLSPEQAKGEVAEVRSDLYSLGIVIYEMATKNLPFTGDSPVGIALQHVQKYPPRPVLFNKRINPDLEKIILKCLEKDKRRRYNDAKDLRKDLILLEEGKKIDYTIKDMDETMVFRKPEDNTAKKRKIKPAGFAFLAIFALSLIFGLYASMGSLFAKEEIETPEIVGKSVVEAKRILKDKGLDLNVDREVYSVDVKKENIITQDPVAKTKVKSGRSINVTISKGPSLVKVPDLLGKDELLADVKLTNANLIMGEIEKVYSSEYPKGEIISQSPLADEEVAEKTEVDIIISKGAKLEKSKVPLLMGMSKTDAESELEVEGLLIGNVSYEESYLYPKGFIISHSPKEASIVDNNQRIDLVLSSGPGPEISEAAIKLNLTESGMLKIVVSDNLGIREEYRKRHYKNDAIAVPISYYGQAVITVYLDDKEIWKQNEPSDLNY